MSEEETRGGRGLIVGVFLPLLLLLLLCGCLSESVSVPERERECVLCDGEREERVRGGRAMKT